MTTPHFDRELLVRLGLGGLDSADGRAIINGLRDLLEIRLGSRISTMFGPGAMKEFELLMNQQNNDSSFRVIEDQVPNVRQVVRQEFESLIDEFKRRIDAKLTNQ